MFHAKLFFYHPALLCHAILLGKNYSTIILPFGRGWFFLSRISSIILPGSINPCFFNPCFWEGVDVACQAFLLSSRIALSFHTTGQTILPLFTPLGGIGFIFSFESLFYHPSLLYQSMLLGGGGCCMPNFSFIILHCSVSHTTRTNTLPFLTPLGGGWFYIHLYIHKFLSRIYSIILHVSPTPNLKKCHSTTDSFLKGLNSLYFSIVSFIILHCSISPCFWEGVDVACQTFHLLSRNALSFHYARKKLLYPYSPLWEGIDIIHIYIHTFLSRISSIILHCSINPCFWEGWTLHVKRFVYHPAKLCHSILLGKVAILPSFTPLRVL